MNRRKSDRIEDQKTYQEIGARLKAVRKALGLKQGQVADVLGVEWKAIWRYESGRTKVDIATLEKLADLFGCSVQYLMFGEGKEPEKAVGIEKLDSEGPKALSWANRIAHNLAELDRLLEGNTFGLCAGCGRRAECKALSELLALQKGIAGDGHLLRILVDKCSKFAEIQRKERVS